MEIRESIAYEAPKWFGDGAQLDSKPSEIRRHAHSFIIRYPLVNTAMNKAVLVKIGRTPDMNSLAEVEAGERLKNLARSEYAIMQSTWQAFERAGATDVYAVQPLKYLESWNAIVMEEVAGQPLKELLFRPPFQRNRRKLLKGLAGAARWLGLFHSGPGAIRLETFPREEVEQKVEAFVEQLEQNSNRQVEVEAFRQTLLSRLSNLAGETLVAQLHGDYHYSNVLLAKDGRVCALDPRNFMRRGPVYADLATLVIDPETRPAQIISWGRGVSPRFVQQARRTILENYYSVVGLEEESESILDFYCALSVLHKWGISEKILNAPGPKGQMALVLRPLVRRHYGHLFNRYLGIRKGR